MIFFVILARITSVYDYGTFRYLITMSLIYAIVFTGIPSALTRYVGKYKEDNIKVNEYLYNSIIIISPIFIILVFIISIIETNNSLLIILVFAALIDALYIGYITGLLNYHKMSGYKLLENIIQLILLIVSYAIFKEVSLVLVIILYSISGILSLILFESYKKDICIKIKFSFDKIKELIRFSIPATVGSIGWTVMFGINAIWINYFYGKEQVGYFSVGETLVSIFSFLPGAIAAIIMPKAAMMKDRSGILKPIIWITIGCSLVSLVMLVPFLFFKELLIKIIFTEKYLNAATLLLPLAIGNIAISIHVIYTSVYFGFNYPKVPAITIVIGCILNMISSFFLTKQYGIIGSAISNAITSTITLALIMLIFYSQFRTLLPPNKSEIVNE